MLHPTLLLPVLIGCSLASFISPHYVNPNAYAYAGPGNEVEGSGDGINRTVPVISGTGSNGKVYITNCAICRLCCIGRNVSYAILTIPSNSGSEIPPPNQGTYPVPPQGSYPLPPPDLGTASTLEIPSDLTHPTPNPNGPYAPVTTGGPPTTDELYQFYPTAPAQYVTPPTTTTTTTIPPPPPPPCTTTPTPTSPPCTYPPITPPTEVITPPAPVIPPAVSDCCYIDLRSIQATVSCGVGGKTGCCSKNCSPSNTIQRQISINWQLISRYFGQLPTQISCAEAVKYGLVQSNEVFGVCPQNYITPAPQPTPERPVVTPPTEVILPPGDAYVVPSGVSGISAIFIAIIATVLCL